MRWVIKYIVFTSVALIYSPAAADEKKNSLVTIDASIPAEFTPEEVFFLTDIEGSGVQKIRAVLLPPLRGGEGGAVKSRWIAGAQLKLPPGVESFSYTVLVKGKEKQYTVIPVLKWSAAEELLGSAESMKTQLDQRAELLKSWQVQVKAQEDNLKRLRVDADTIANVSRIVDVMDQIEATKYENENLDKDLESLNELFKQAKDQSSPKNYVRRELDLTKQTAELVNVVKNAESQEASRRTQSQGDLQRKLAIVEATRFDDIEKLRAELADLKGRVAKLSASGLKDEPKGGENYWDSQ